MMIMSQMPTYVTFTSYMVKFIPDFGRSDNMKTSLFLLCGYYSRFGARFLR